MHALGEYIEREMEGRGWDRKTLIRRSGLTKQHISQLLANGKTSLGRMPDEKTVHGLSAAFGVSEEVIITKAAEAMGVPVDRLALVVVDPEAISNEALVKLVERRLLGEGGQDARQADAEKMILVDGGAGEQPDQDDDPTMSGQARGVTLHGRAPRNRNKD